MYYNESMGFCVDLIIVFALISRISSLIFGLYWKVLKKLCNTELIL